MFASQRTKGAPRAASFFPGKAVHAPVVLQGGAVVVAAAYKAAMRFTTLLLSRGVGSLRPSSLERGPLLLSALRRQSYYCLLCFLCHEDAPHAVCRHGLAFHAKGSLTAASVVEWVGRGLSVRTESSVRTERCRNRCPATAAHANPRSSSLPCTSVAATSPGLYLANEHHEPCMREPNTPPTLAHARAPLSRTGHLRCVYGDQTATPGP